jgi:hypothetical protein
VKITHYSTLLQKYKLSCEHVFYSCLGINASAVTGYADRGIKKWMEHLSYHKEAGPKEGGPYNL